MVNDHLSWVEEEKAVLVDCKLGVVVGFALQNRLKASFRDYPVLLHRKSSQTADAHYPYEVLVFVRIWSNNDVCAVAVQLRLLNSGLVVLAERQKLEFETVIAGS